MPPPPAIAAAEPHQQVVEAHAFEAHLRSLQAATTELSRPLALRRIAAVVADAAIEALDAQAVLIAVHEDPEHLRGVHVAGLPEEVRRRLCAFPNTRPLLIEEIERSLRRAGSAAATVTLAALPISQGERNLGLLVLGRSHDRPFSDDERTFLVVLTGLCALALDRLRMFADRANVLAVLRRREIERANASSRLRVGDLEIDLEAQSVAIGGDSASLTPCELRVLTFLAEPPGRARSRHEILRHLWHTDHVGDERACDVHISNLRRKIEQDPSRPERLVTLRGFGYALRAR